MTNSATVTSDEAADVASSAPVSLRSFEPLDLLLIVLTFGAALWVIDPIYDINDVFWHVLIGDEIRAGVPFSELGSNFSFGWENTEWRTGAWGSEFLMSWLYDIGGWNVLVNVIRLTTVLAVSLILWRGVVLRFPSRAVVVPYTLAMLVLVLAVQERPQSLSFIFLTLAGVWWYRAVAEGHVPHWAIVAIVSVLWANLHGLWILLPGVLLLALLGRLADHGPSDQLLRRLGVLASISLASGLMTPLGIQGLLLPLQIRGAASQLVSEWELTALFGWPGYTLLISGGLTLYLLGRTGAGRAAGVYAVIVILFGLMAVRNVTPAVLLLTPLLAGLINDWLGSRAHTSVSPGERRRLLQMAWALVAVGTLSVVATVTMRTQGLPDELPVELASQLPSEPGEVRLLNDYNYSGVALFFGGPNLRVAVDGRTDFYGAEYLERYQDAMTYGRDLDELVQELKPTHALLRSDSAAAALLSVQGWRELDASEDSTLLVAP